MTSKTRLRAVRIEEPIGLSATSPLSRVVRFECHAGIASLTLATAFRPENSNVEIDGVPTTLPGAEPPAEALIEDELFREIPIEAFHEMEPLWAEHVCQDVLALNIWDTQDQLQKALLKELEENGSLELTAQEQNVVKAAKMSRGGKRRLANAQQVSIKTIIYSKRWARLYSEPLSVVWIAALALYERHVARSGYRFCVLARMLQEKLTKEDDFLRGEKILADARAGGETQAVKARVVADPVLAEMRRMVAKGKSVSSAAHIAAKNGLGTSQAANRKLWYRRNKNL